MNRHRSPRRAWTLLVVAALAVAAQACATGNAYRGGQRFSEKGDWDMAVARFTKAHTDDPSNIKYKIALENAKIQASRMHVEKARKLVQAGNLEKGMEEFGVAVGYDPANKAASDDMAVLKARIEALAEEKRQVKELAARRPADAILPVPFLSPRSPVPIRLNMTAPLDKVYQTLGIIVGVNVVFDPDMQNKERVITANVSGITFQEALDQIGLVNKKAYRVLDRNTILIFDDTNAQTRQRWDDQVMRTFYLENVEVKDVEAALRAALGTTSRVTKNDATNSITVISTLDEMALADRFLRSNDKPKGEILVEVEILEINRTKAKEYGIQLSNYQVGAELRPTGAENEVADGLTNLRSIFLSSLNAADWVVQIPSAIFAKFLQNDSIVKILSSPKVRAFEGKKATFNVGTDTPIPQFYPGYQQNVVGGAAGGGFGGTTSAQYKTVGVNLEIDKAKVTANNEITLEFKAEFSVIGEDKVFGTGLNAVNYPQFLSRKLENTLRLTDGVTAVIGGLLQGREARTLKGILGMDSIPLLNKLMGGHQTDDQEIEILISLTPHILRAPNILPEDVEPLYLGLRNNLKIPGVRPLFGPEVAPEPEGRPVPPPSADVPSPAATPTPTPADPAPALPPLLAPASPGVPLATRAAWDRSEVQMKVGEVQRVAINLFNVRDVREVSLALRVDSAAAIELVEIGSGQLLSVDGVQVLVERQFEGSRASAQLRRPTPLAGGTGTVAIVGFRALRQGDATIFVEGLTLSSGAIQGQVPLAGAVRVTVTP